MYMNINKMSKFIKNIIQFNDKADRCQFIYARSSFVSQKKKGDRCENWTYRSNGYCKFHRKYHHKGPIKKIRKMRQVQFIDLYILAEASLIISQK